MKKTVLLVALGFFAVFAAFAQAGLQPAATVNLTRTEPITVNQLRQEVERMERSAGGRTMTQQDVMQVLDIMINERLALQAAERDRITVTDNEVNQHIQELRASMAQGIGRQPSDAEFAQAIRAETGMELPAFREQLRRQMTVQRYLMTSKESVFRSIQIPTEQDIRSTFDLARAQFVRPDTVRFSMIQVPFGPDAASRARARTQADNLANEIGGVPARFNEVVTRSQAPNSGIMAGDAGFLPRTMDARAMVGQNLLDTAFSLRNGEVSGVIEGTVGFQIILVTETYAMQNLDLGDIAFLGTNVTVRDQIGNTLLQQRQQEAMARASQELVTELRAGRPFRIFEENVRALR
ncbi:MAG: SurA N-terminal domain-containing protein [Spirochaetes bacterium]|nr:SurA N-terminal domain-containing protein [Spirochaetota bacterium]